MRCGMVFHYINWEAECHVKYPKEISIDSPTMLASLVPQMWLSWVQEDWHSLLDGTKISTGGTLKSLSKNCNGILAYPLWFFMYKSYTPKLWCTRGWSGCQLRAWHSYRWEDHGESCMIWKRVVIRPPSFLHFRREENCILYAETNRLSLAILWLWATISNLISILVSLLWPCRFPNSLLQCHCAQHNYHI